MENEDIENLTLLLAYLTSWDENPKKQYGDKPIMRAWKGYDFDILNSLENKGYITQSRGAKSLHITDKGLNKAKELSVKFFNY